MAQILGVDHDLRLAHILLPLHLQAAGFLRYSAAAQDCGFAHYSGCLVRDDLVDSYSAIWPLGHVVGRLGAAAAVAGAG